MLPLGEMLAPGNPNRGVVEQVALTLSFLEGNLMVVGLICIILFGARGWPRLRSARLVTFSTHALCTGERHCGPGMGAMLLTSVVVNHGLYLLVLIAAGIFPRFALASIFLVVRCVEPVRFNV